MASSKHLSSLSRPDAKTAIIWREKPRSQIMSERAVTPSMNTGGLCTAVMPLNDWLESELVLGLKLGREVQPIIYYFVRILFM